MTPFFGEYHSCSGVFYGCLGPLSSQVGGCGGAESRLGSDAITRFRHPEPVPLGVAAEDAPWNPAEGGAIVLMP